MFKSLFGLKKEDVCPNCGTRCFATDVVCPNCGKNLDDLFEQLPDDGRKRTPLLNLPGEPQFLIEWASATSVGLALGRTILAVLIFSPISVYVPQCLLCYWLWSASGTGVGIGVGTFQWLVLRAYRLLSWQWIAVTVLGAVVAEVATQSLLKLPGWPGDWLPGFLFGSILGAWQWLLLRKHLRAAWLWIVVTGLGCMLGSAMASRFLHFLFYPLDRFGFTQYAPCLACDLAIYGATGLVLGVSTAMLLWWLLRHSGVTFHPQEAAG